MAVLEDGSDLDAELVTALVALINTNTGALAAHFGNAINTAAMRAYRTFRPYASFDPSVCSGFVLQDFGFEN